MSRRRYEVAPFHDAAKPLSPDKPRALRGGSVVLNRSHVLAGILCSVFMTAVEATVVATAMPSVIADLGGVALYGWVTAAYLLASTVTVPLYGKLADMRGRKPVMLFGLALFLVGSAASGAATSTLFLIGARAIQGLGAGAIAPVAITIVGDIYNIEERGRVQGWLGAVWAIAGAAGPLVGGFFVATLSWRWVFWFNLPFGVAAFLVLWRVYHESAAETSKPMRLDWLGATSLTIASVALLVLAERRAVGITLPLTCATLIVFMVSQKRVNEPVIPAEFFRSRFITMALLLSAAVGCVMLGFLTYAPLYVQGVLARSPAEAGSVVTPMLVAWPTASFIIGRNLRRVGFRLPVVAGLGVTALGSVLLAICVPGATSIWPWWMGSFFLGAGMGMCVVTITVAMQSSVPWNQRGAVTALGMFTRSMGSAMGVGGLGALLIAGLETSLDPERIGALLAHGDGSAPHIDQAAQLALAASFGPLLWTMATVAMASFGAALAYRPPDVQPAVSASTVAE